MTSKNINLNYFQLIIKNRIISGLYSIYSDINNVYNSLVNSNKVNNKTISIEDLLKKALQNIPDLSQNLIEKEFKLILTENNLTEEVFDEIFYGIFLNIVYSISDNKDFIKHIKPQLQNINKYDFIKKCYIEISRIILQNDYIYIINIKNNTLLDNVAYNEIIKECVIKSIYNCINLKNIIEYSKKFKDVEVKPEKPKDYTNDLNELKLQIKTVSDNLTLLKNNINNYVPPQHMTETKIEIPSIDIPVGKNVFNEQATLSKKEVESSEIKKNDIPDIKPVEILQDINPLDKTESVLKNIMILSEKENEPNNKPIQLDETVNDPETKQNINLINDNSIKNEQINEPETKQDINQLIHLNEPNNKQEINQINKPVNELDTKPVNEPEIKPTNEQETKQDINIEIDQQNKENDDMDDINKLIQTELQNKMNKINEKEPQEGGANKKLNEDSDNIIESLNLEESINPDNLDIDSFLNKI